MKNAPLKTESLEISLRSKLYGYNGKTVLLTLENPKWNDHVICQMTDLSGEPIGNIELERTLYKNLLDVPPIWEVRIWGDSTCKITSYSIEWWVTTVHFFSSTHDGKYGGGSAHLNAWKELPKKPISGLSLLWAVESDISDLLKK
jgi:hypothetical protein